MAIRASEIKQLVEEHGPEGYLAIQHDLLEGKTLPNGVTVKKDASEFSLRALWEGLVGSVDDTMTIGQRRLGYVEQAGTLSEQVSTASFASATGQLISSKVIEGYNAAPAVGDNLVTTMQSNLRDERLVGFTHLQGPKDVGENETYEDSTFSDKYVTTQQSKKGRLLSVTEEAVTFDQTGQVLLRASALGEATRAERERVIVRGIADVASTERVYRPSGTAEQLYAAGNNNLLATATPLVDWTDVQEVMAYHATNVTDDRTADDGMGAQPILWAPKQILTSVKLAGTAARIVSATTVGTPPNGSGAAMDTANPVQVLTGGQLSAYASPYLDAAEGADQFDDADDWYIGDFTKQFVWKEIWPLQVMRAPSNAPDYFERDIVACYKVRYYGGINAIDERWVVKVNAV